MKEVQVGDLVWRSLACGEPGFPWSSKKLSSSLFPEMFPCWLRKAVCRGNKDEVLEEQVKQLSLVNIFENFELPEPQTAFEELRPGPATLARLNRLVGDGAVAEVLPPTVPRLTVLCRTPEQAEAVLRLPAGRDGCALPESGSDST